MTHLIDFMVMMPLGAHFIDAFGAAPADLARLVFAYTASAAVAGVLVSTFIDRFDRGRVLCVVYVAFLLSLLVTASAGSLDELVRARAFAGMSGGVLSALIQSLVSEVAPPGQRAGAIGRVMSGHALSAVIGVPAGLWLAAASGWQAPFVAVVFVSLWVVVGLLRHLPPLPPRRGSALPDAPGTPTPGAFRYVLSRRALGGFVLTFLVTSSCYAVIAYIAPYWVKNVGIAETRLPWIYLLAGGISFFTTPLAGRLADRHGRFPVFAVTGLLSAAGIVLATHAPALPLAGALCVSSVFFVFVYARWAPTVAILAELPPGPVRGAFMMLNGVTTQFGMGAGAMFSGAVIQIGPNGGLVGFGMVGNVAAVLSLAGIVLARRLTRHA
ncbi:MFS transporter [Aromatoleum toluclasticum]|uniref:MFS transporter n=1 Tax=Aromatoleum toluclasticum TaxID=92003 RepID=UPI001D1881A9|nr:MFS transporter [Aromatoleum toluclasticum]MCC4118228.1 MFS transporter [Aromatoleum toluclasticum]